jgi:hypothetical protein
MTAGGRLSPSQDRARRPLAVSATARPILSTVWRIMSRVSASSSTTRTGPSRRTTRLSSAVSCARSTGLVRTSTAPSESPIPRSGATTGRRGQRTWPAMTPHGPLDSFCGGGSPHRAVRRSDSWAGSAARLLAILGATAPHRRQRVAGCGAQEVADCRSRDRPRMPGLVGGFAQPAAPRSSRERTQP